MSLVNRPNLNFPLITGRGCTTVSLHRRSYDPGTMNLVQAFPVNPSSSTTNCETKSAGPRRHSGRSRPGVTKFRIKSDSSTD